VVDNAAAATPVVMEPLQGGANLVIEGMEQYRPNFDEVFVRLLEQEAEHV
jgi:hypothetical protein